MYMTFIMHRLDHEALDFLYFKCYNKCNIFVAYRLEKIHDKCVMTCSGSHNQKPFPKIRIIFSFST